MKITVLVDNNENPRRPDLHAEHGLSLLVETRGLQILFDTGASSLFLDNAGLLGLDLSRVSAVVLSHGHYDHGGGLAAFAAINAHARVYAGPGAFEGHSIKAVGPFRKSIGVRKGLQSILGDRVSIVEAQQEIAGGVFLQSRIEAPARASAERKAFYRDTADGVQEDDFAHEVMLAVVEKDGLVLFTGCSHNGILNMIEAARKAFPVEEIKAVIGGFHLTNPVTRKLAETQDTITAMGRTLAGNSAVRRVFSGHCTGKAAYQLLKHEMGEKLDQLEVGMQIVL
jgi:7,8-dihydropterin-6-yl-methyl-4-(beta-D-ribofuranosyl)aminobenzene 5'-phosphate synthase